MTGEHRKPLRNAIFLIAGLLLFWQLMYSIIGEVAMRSPWQTMQYTFKLAQTELLWTHLVNTLAAFAVALGIAVVLGLLIGFALGLHRLSAEAMEPVLVALDQYKHLDVVRLRGPKGADAWLRALATGVTAQRP